MVIPRQKKEIIYQDDPQELPSAVLLKAGLIAMVTTSSVFIGGSVIVSAFVDIKFDGLWTACLLAANLLSFWAAFGIFMVMQWLGKRNNE